MTAQKNIQSTLRFLFFAGSLFLIVLSGTGCRSKAAEGNSPSTQELTQTSNAIDSATVTLNDAQLKSVKIEPVGRHIFTVQREAVGNIDFNQDRSVQVYPPNQGKIIELFANLGDNVAKGKKLYTINSPDLAQVESALIAATGVFDLTNHVLERARKLYEVQGIAQKIWNRQSPTSRPQRVR